MDDVSPELLRCVAYEGSDSEKYWTLLKAADELSTLAAEVRAQRDRAERAERVAVWAALKGAHAGYDGDSNPCIWYAVERSCQTRGGLPVRSAIYNGTDADLYRALVEAMKGGRDRG